MNIVVAVPVDENLAAFIGKKGSANSITFYNRKSGSDVIVVLFPSQEDEKIHALAESLLIASQIMLSTSVLDKKFGEALVASSLLDKKLTLTSDNSVEQVVKGMGMGAYQVVTKEEVLQVLQSNANVETPKVPVRIDLDKAFPVKGIGTVALGIVTKGVLNQHDKLYHTSGKQVTVRSIQSQDDDITSAGVGTRVGVSLKDIEADEMKKGDLLTVAPVTRAKRMVITYKSSPAAKEKMAEGALYRLALGFSYSECIVAKSGDSEVELTLNSPMPAEIGDEVLLVREKVPRIFASGRVKQKLE
jgi:selenocysteine-specific translation elongation factor